MREPEALTGSSPSLFNRGRKSEARGGRPGRGAPPGSAVGRTGGGGVAGQDHLVAVEVGDLVEPAAGDQGVQPFAGGEPRENQPDSSRSARTTRSGRI